MTTKTVLVTGASGFIAPYLIKALVVKDCATKVVGIYRNENNHPTEVLENVKYRQCDLADMDSVNELFLEFSFDVVIHVAAALGPLNDPCFSIIASRDNIQAHANLINASKNAKCKRFIYFSTISVYTYPSPRKEGYREDDIIRPNTVYGWSKYAAEELLRIETESSDMMKGVSLRIAGAHGYGRHGGIIYNMLQNSLYGKDIILTEPNSCFRLAFIEDAVDALLLILNHKLPDRYCCYNVAGEDLLTLSEWGNKVLTAAGKEGNFTFNDTGKQRNEFMDISRIKEEVGFQPRPLINKLDNYLSKLR
jgi:nucleoside-diphosphate-sugar epimerase